MDRTVPRTGSEDIELYIRTYYSLLRSSAEVRIRTLEEAHARMGSSLHPDARGLAPDMSAFIYCSLRLPACLAQTERVILGQSRDQFIQAGLGDVERWKPVEAPARRRVTFFDGDSTLAIYIASRTDIDDIIPLLTAYQIEWNKMHARMRGEQVRAFLREPVDTLEGMAALGAGMGVAPEDLERLRVVWREEFWPMLRQIASVEMGLAVRLLAGTMNDYRRATIRWFDHVLETFPALTTRPVYFVSGNTHSLVNLLTGFALRHQDEILAFVAQVGHEDLQQEWIEIEARSVPSSRENFLYYALKKLLASPGGETLAGIRAEAEQVSGILRIPSEHGFDIQAQVVDLRSLRADWVDPRLQRENLGRLTGSDALLLNIDYPLGMAAYLVLTEVAARVGELRGVYLMGKAATLNGVIGDVMIPTVVHDEHSQNTYLFQNVFTAESMADDLTYGTVLDNQKGVSVRGTFLQTPRYMDVFYREGYTDIEMEAGPYLSAIYEISRPKRHPDNEIVNLYGLPFDLGILHYASDTPLSKGRNLGSGSLSYFGMDPTYATALAILKRILGQEVGRTATDRVDPTVVARSR
ncbi:MAG TPA: hypothetical protein VLL77_07435 [Anaerolineales bacterium]|nr:hypothetical protein [Anaerolineales bacterium]